MNKSALPNEWRVHDLFIRKADISDTQSMTEIKNACHYLHPFDENFYISDSTEYRDILLNNESWEEKSVLYCIEKNNLLIGFIRLHYHYPSEQMMWIESFIIHPNEQRKGNGKVILRFLEEQSALLGVTASRLKVYLKNYSAVRFWISCGYNSIIEFNSEDMFEQYSNRVSLVLEKTLS